MSQRDCDQGLDFEGQRPDQGFKVKDRTKDSRSKNGPGSVGLSLRTRTEVSSIDVNSAVPSLTH